jgi:hypothetical protein
MKKELGRNMINRILFFTLNTGIQEQLPYQLLTELVLNDYESSRENLIVNILTNALHVNDLTEASFEYLVTKIDERPYPNFLIVLEGNTRFAREKDFTILENFFIEFNAAYIKWGKKEIFVFLNIVDENTNENLLMENVAPLLKCGGQNIPFVFCLPRLKPANSDVIEQWISTYLTGDEENISELMETHFGSLMKLEEFTMLEAQKNIEDLLQKINSGDKDLIKILKS